MFTLQCMQVSSRVTESDGSSSIIPYHMSSECGMKHVLIVLGELERFLSVSDNPRERKNRQKLLRNLKVYV